MKFTLDTNILIMMEQRYPREFFASLWDSLETAINARTVCICDTVQTELERGDDGLAPWAKGLPGFVCQIGDDELNVVYGIAKDHPGWASEKQNYADPFVIAHAKVADKTIVTEERRKGPGTEDRNQKIPNVAEEHAVKCIKFFELLRYQGWTF